MSLFQEWMMRILIWALQFPLGPSHEFVSFLLAHLKRNMRLLLLKHLHLRLLLLKHLQKVVLSPNPGCLWVLEHLQALLHQRPRRLQPECIGAMDQTRCLSLSLSLCLLMMVRTLGQALGSILRHLQPP